MEKNNSAVVPIDSLHHFFLATSPRTVESLTEALTNRLIVTLLCVILPVERNFLIFLFDCYTNYVIKSSNRRRFYNLWL